MKKLVMTAAVIACAASVVTAQTVTSANIVGYNKEISVGGFVISGMQFDNPTNTPSVVYGDSLPLGSRIYTWNGAEYDITTYANVFVPIQGLVTKWSSDPVLGNGMGYWVESAGAAESILAGEVPMDASVTNSIPVGFELLSYPYPVDRTIASLGFTPSVGDRIYLWTGSDYEIITYSQVFVPIQGLVVKWSNENAPVSVGEGFWYEAVAPQQWVVNKPF